MSVASWLVGRESELGVLDRLLDDIRRRGGSLTVTGGPGIGKSALLTEAAARAADRGMLVLRATGVQSEALLAFAGLHLLLRPVLGQLDRLAPPQRDAMRMAFGLADGHAPDLFLTALATLELLAESAARAPVLVVADDVQWLDRPTRDVLAFVARRLEFEPVLLVTAVLDGYDSPLDAGTPTLRLAALPEAAAAALLGARAPGLPGAVRRRLLAEAAGNPLALAELPAAYAELGKGARVPAWLPLTTRLERAFAARAFDLPAATRTALLVAAVDDGPLVSEVLDAAALLVNQEVTIDVLAPAVSAQLVEVSGSEFRFRHPLMRAAIRQEASIAQRHAAHAALAGVLASQPGRRVWHRAASILGPDEAVARELEATALRAHGRGGTAVAVSALQRAADLSSGPQRAGRLLRAAELGFEIGQRDLVLSLLADAEALGLPSREQARLTWIRESFTDGISGDATRARLLAAAAGQAAADGDTDLALKLLYGASLRCWWADPGQATRDHIVAAAERLDLEESDPRLLVVLAFAAPIGRGAVVIDRLPKLVPAAGSDVAAMRLAGNAAMAVGAFDVAAQCLEAAAAGLRAQARLGLLARALALQAWSAAHLADLGAAIPAAEEARRLAQETTQPLVVATAEAVQAMLAALRGDHEAAEALAARAEQASLPLGASGVLAAAQLARGLAALGGGRPAQALGHLRRIHDPGDPAYHAANRCYTIGDLAEAALRSGDPQGTQGIGVFMQEMETAARQTPSPSLHGGLRYARALLAAGGEADGLFRRALQSGMSAGPFLRARVQLAYGEWLHQQRQDAAARAPLRAARETFDALGVIPWSERARQQLRATGETSRPRTAEARDQLTPQELQIAQMAADGLTNREIGQKLYLSHRTVSSHLYRAFPKLGITSRAELRHVLQRSAAARSSLSGYVSNRVAGTLNQCRRGSCSHAFLGENMDPADLIRGSVMVRVAIVDDHPIARHGVEQVLERVDGLRVVASAASPGELADQMPGTDERPDVVILDLYYGDDAPGMEAIGRLGTAARVLVMSASGRPADVLGAIRAGAAGYITKQADGPMFATAVEAVARGGFWLSAELADIVHAELSRDPHPARPRRPTAGDLSPREQETLTLIASGFTYSQVATRMGISKATVDTYIERIRGKLQVGNKAELIRAALERLPQPSPS